MNLPSTRYRSLSENQSHQHASYHGRTDCPLFADLCAFPLLNSYISYLKPQRLQRINTDKHLLQNFQFHYMSSCKDVMGSRQNSNFDGVHPQYDEGNPPPPYYLAVGESRPFPEQGNLERNFSRPFPPGLETQDAAATTTPPTSTDPLSESLENIDLQLELRLLQLELRFNSENWHLYEGTILRIRGRLDWAESQLAESQRQREVAAHVRSTLESRLHSTQALLTAAEIRAASAKDRARALEKEKEQIVADTVSLKQRLLLITAGKQFPPPGS